MSCYLKALKVLRRPSEDLGVLCPLGLLHFPAKAPHRSSQDCLNSQGCRTGSPSIWLRCSQGAKSDTGSVPKLACAFSCIRFFAPPWTVAHQAPLSMKFSQQEYWSGLTFPSPGDIPDPGIEPTSLMSPALAGRFFTTAPPRKPFEELIPVLHKLLQKIEEKTLPWSLYEDNIIVIKARQQHPRKD